MIFIYHHSLNLFERITSLVFKKKQFQSKFKGKIEFSTTEHL